jgi:hypothetical protein
MAASKKRGRPIEKRNKTNKVLSNLSRAIWGIIGLLVLLTDTWVCFPLQACNPIIAGIWGIVGLSCLMVAGLPCHKLVSVFAKG